MLSCGHLVWLVQARLPTAICSSVELARSEKVVGIGQHEASWVSCCLLCLERTFCCDHDRLSPHPGNALS